MGRQGINKLSYVESWVIAGKIEKKEAIQEIYDEFLADIKSEKFPAIKKALTLISRNNIKKQKICK
jgi:hypothetical protein